MASGVREKNKQAPIFNENTRPNKGRRKDARDNEVGRGSLWVGSIHTRVTPFANMIEEVTTLAGTCSGRDTSVAYQAFCIGCGEKQGAETCTASSDRSS